MTTGAEPHERDSFAALALGAVGVVFGDIGTSPLYAFREALGQVDPSTIGPEATNRMFWLAAGGAVPGAQILSDCTDVPSVNR